MTTVATEARPVLAVIPDVELAHVGMNWPMSRDGVEEGTLTPEDLAAAVAAQDDPSIRTPVVKFGHVVKLDPLGDGAPVWGRATNLRLADEGMTLVGDLAGVPTWLAEVLPSAWPSRSIEAKRNTTSDVGRTHGLVITAVSLLGVVLPAISTLAEVQAVWSARTPEEAHVTLQEVSMPTTTASRRPVDVAASTTTEDIRRAYYDQLPSGSYWWIREMSLDPLALIVEADDGDLYQVPVTVAGTDITFGTPVEVRVEYVPADDGASTSASRNEREAIVFASRTESREGVAGMDHAAELRRVLGLAEDASDEDVQAAIAARSETTDDTANPPGAVPPVPTATLPPVPPTPPTAPETEPAGDGSVRISQAVLDQLQADAQLGVAAARRQAQDDEDAFIARNRNRLGPASNPLASRLEASWRREWQRNRGEAEALAASHAIVVPTAPIGHGGNTEDVGGGEGDAIYAALYGAEKG